MSLLEEQIQAVLDILAPRIVGRELSHSGCFCGEQPAQVATATQIQVPIEDRARRVTWPHNWTVLMVPNPEEPGESYGVGIGSFVALEELYLLFREHFGPPIRITGEVQPIDYAALEAVLEDRNTPVISD